jgi:mono/diheme cytochrome c family protein
MTQSMKKTLGATALFFGLTTASVAFPWDIDMVDALFVRGYEAPMAELNDEIVTNRHRANGLEHMDPEEVEADWKSSGGIITIMKAAPSAQLEDPYAGMEKDDYVLNQGELAFRTYCQTCHGIKGTGKTLSEDTWPLQKTGRFVGIPNVHLLDGGKIGQYGAGAMKTHNELYILIRNGRGRMPSYGHAMSDEEIWSAIHYIKDLPGKNFAD